MEIIWESSKKQDEVTACRSIGAAGTYLCAGKLPACGPAPMAQLAWWGGVYPEYCLPGAVKLVGEEETAGTEEEIPVKVQFKYLTFLND